MKTYNLDEWTFGDLEKQSVGGSPESAFQDRLLYIMQICNWKNRDVAGILDVSLSTINNLLGNESMTNANKSTLTRPQFVMLMEYLQMEIMQKEKISIVFFLFGFLCPGIMCSTDSRKFIRLAELERETIKPSLLIKIIEQKEWCLGCVKTFNLFMEWQGVAPEKTFMEYLGIPDEKEFVFSIKYEECKTPVQPNDVKIAVDNVFRFIPVYLNWYFHAIQKTEMLY